MKVKINGEEVTVKKDGAQVYSPEQMAKFKKAIFGVCAATMTFLVIGKNAIDLLQDVSSTFLYGMNVDVVGEMVNGVILLFSVGGGPLLLVLGLAGYSVYKGLKGGDK